MDGSGSPRRLRVFNRLQHTGSAAPLGARKKYSLAHCNRNAFDLADCGPIGRFDGSFSRTVARQSRSSRKLVADFHTGNRDRHCSPRAGGSLASGARGGMRSLGFEELSTWGQFQDVVRHMSLPTLVLVLASIAVVERHVRASVLEVLEAPYIQAARGLGISRP